MSQRFSLAIVMVSAQVLIGCASGGPVVPVPPEVLVTQLDSLLFTPDLVKFQAKIVIENRMGAGLNIDRVAYGADLHDAPVFTENFTQLHPMKARGRQTVTFPFQISMEDIGNQAADVLAEEALRVRFRGEVFPSGFDAIPFQATKNIPLPRIPVVSFEGCEGSPFEKVFTVFLKIQNPNTFSLGFKSIDSYLEINGKKYSLLRTQGAASIGPGSDGKIALSMEQSTGKTLSMVLNTARSPNPRFAVGGSISCNTPHGLVYIPLRLSAEAGVR